MRPLLAYVFSALCAASQAIATGQPPAPAGREAARPNIVLIYADDIGYGDLSCYGAKKVATPNIDRLAAQGLRFTDAHSVASVCTPSRYSLLTGKYAFRQPGTGIASGVEGLLVDPARTTLPSMLKGSGYATGIVGKWHLGLGVKPTDYNGKIRPGPNDVGFEYAWIMPATGDRVPCVWVENDRVVNLDPTDPIKLDYRVKRGEPRSFVNGVPRIGEQTGGEAALWDDENISTVVAQKSNAFMERHQAGPFFLEVSTHNIHVPRVPNPRFIGKSDCGVRGDAIVELDWIVGEVLGKLEALGLADNTLVMFSSDNGGVLDDNGPDKVHGVGDPDGSNGHGPNGVLRGQKGTVWEGGTRVPMIARWPGHVRRGVSDALVSQVDLLASLAALTGESIPAGEAPDSENQLAALMGVDSTGRRSLVEQRNADLFGFRQGMWKLFPAVGRGKGGEARLYNLADDLGETNDLAADQPGRVKEMTDRFNQIVGDSVVQKSPRRRGAGK
ncbi:Arylsulfatase [Pirellulimonas nuda]|uniref:Arylsulfatase n=1 Tax=Pirellulimonas nuda TaxID=2528009 RepID=A0A518DBX4_9BACT|nr:arylsulfatase [Pirellulimonas nuda]QDU88963.1 Arylsulfatase [Pirellulimonas nuda]